MLNGKTGRNGKINKNPCNNVTLCRYMCKVTQNFLFMRIFGDRVSFVSYKDS